MEETSTRTLRIEEQVQVVGHRNCRFTITLGSYFVKSHYFSTILNLLILLQFKSMISIKATIQLLSIVTRKRGGKRNARYERTGITLRIEETSTLRVTLRIEGTSTLRVMPQWSGVG